MSMKITQVQGGLFRAEYRGAEVFAGRVDPDSPYVGISPGNLMVAALGMCNGVYIEDYLRREGIEYESIEITVDRKYERDPPRATEFDVRIVLRGDLSEEERKGALEAAHGCYVGNTFEGRPKINISMTG
ncbi:OsmC family peroxiredoxin [Candidatus Bathyarchaeota archaeon]|nr:OsmC family peroxiredoxin [Candidatus Bathyarchaeota archaeon]